MTNTVLKGFVFSVSLLASSPAWACVGCGMAESFTPRMLVIGLGFVAMPASAVLFVIYRIWRDQKKSKSVSARRQHG